MTKDIEKTLKLSEFLTWLEKEWNDSFCSMTTIETISELGMTEQEAINKFKFDTE